MRTQMCRGALAFSERGLAIHASRDATHDASIVNQAAVVEREGGGRHRDGSFDCLLQLVGVICKWGRLIKGPFYLQKEREKRPDSSGLLLGSSLCSCCAQCVVWQEGGGGGDTALFSEGDFSKAFWCGQNVYESQFFPVCAEFFQHLPEKIPIRTKNELFLLLHGVRRSHPAQRTNHSKPHLFRLATPNP